MLPDEDQGSLALSNRVRFNSPIYVLPPFDTATRKPIPYPLEPYLLNEMANRYDETSPPLIPFAQPGGSLQVSVRKPDGTTDNFGSLRMTQNLLSTAAQDEHTLFGEQSPVDVYRLTTGDPRLTRVHLRPVRRLHDHAARAVWRTCGAIATAAAAPIT